MKDGHAFVEYSAWYENETSVARRVISQTNQSIFDLNAAIEEADAFQASESDRHTKVANQLTVAQKELDDATKQRKKEKTAFLEQETTLVEGVQSLTSSLDVLAKAAPAQTAEPAALVAVMKRVRSSLLQDHDLRMTDSQRYTLDSFLRSAVRAAREKTETTADSDGAPEFLQVRRQLQEPYGDYERQSGGAVSTLQSVLDKTQTALDAARKEEATAAADFKKFEEASTESIANKEKTLSEIKSAIAHSQERESQMRGEVASEKNLLKVTIEGLEELEADYSSKRKAFSDRTHDRSDELDAIRNAAQALTSDTAQTLLNHQKEKEEDQEDKEAANFLQTEKASTRTASIRRKALGILRRSTTPGMALLALDAHTTASQSTADPFGKVKNMLFDMMQRLLEEQNKEAEHHGWCDKEMGRNTVAQKTKQEKLQMLTTRIDSLEAELSELGEDITSTGHDLEAMQGGLGQATRVRSQQSAEAKHAIQEYKDAQGLIETAIRILEKHYKKKALAAGATEDTKQRRDYGGGVIALLEVALSDFRKLQKVAEESEAASQAQYAEFQKESQVRIAVFQKELEYLDRNKVKLELDKTQYESDRKNYAEELSAVGNYLSKLKEECIAKAEPYEERKQRREAELASLKDALQFLRGDGMAPQPDDADDSDE